jgi:hypothetical protein
MKAELRDYALVILGLLWFVLIAFVCITDRHHVDDPHLDIAVDPQYHRAGARP